MTELSEFRLQYAFYDHAAEQAQRNRDQFVADWKHRYGLSWAHIARELGISRQAVHKRWGHITPTGQT